MAVRSCKEYRETPSPSSSAEPPAALSGTSLELVLRLPDAVSCRRLSPLRGGCGARVGLRVCRGTAVAVLTSSDISNRSARFQPGHRGQRFGLRGGAGVRGDEAFHPSFDVGGVQSAEHGNVGARVRYQRLGAVVD